MSESEIKASKARLDELQAELDEIQASIPGSDVETVDEKFAKFHDNLDQQAEELERLHKLEYELMLEQAEQEG
jgi:uncharacterized protein YukE